MEYLRCFVRQTWQTDTERDFSKVERSVMNSWVTIDGCNYQIAGFKSSLIDVISSMSDY